MNRLIQDTQNKRELKTTIEKLVRQFKNKKAEIKIPDAEK
jgi:hypothetical protein